MAKPFVNKALSDRGGEAEDLYAGFLQIRDIFEILLIIFERDDLPLAARGYDSVVRAAISLTDEYIRDANALADKLYSYARNAEGKTGYEKQED